MNWRRIIADMLLESAEILRIISDPGGLLLDEELLGILQEENIRVVSYEDPLRFRLIYEEDFREKWDANQMTPILAVRTVDLELTRLPYDIIQGTQPIYLSLAHIFPNLNIEALKGLDSRAYDHILAANDYPASVVDYDGSCLLIIRALYRTDPTLIAGEEDVLSLISRIHATDFEISPTLALWLSSLLKDCWSSHSSLYDMMLSWDKWQEYLAQVSRRTDLLSLQGSYWLKKLRGDDHIAEERVSLSEQTYREIEAFLRRDHRVGLDWLEKAYDIGRIYLASYLNQDEDKDSNTAITHAIDTAFYHWVLDHYSLMTSLPPLPRPKMVHHIPQWISQKWHTSHDKWALIVLDGLSLPQWIYLRQFLSCTSENCEQFSCLAWVPSITSVSRQAIFSGQIPRAIRGSIFDTHGEEKAWKTFWKEEGLDLYHVVYQSTVDKITVEDFMQTIDSREAVIVGCVANMADELAHSAQMGPRQILLDLKHWVQNTKWLPKIIQSLQDRRFHIVITSDHGHTPVHGIGKPPSGVLSKTRGQRAQIYPSEILLNQVNQDKKWGIVWPYVHTLPLNTFVLLARSHEAFFAERQGMSHGSIAWEELMVPVVVIW